MSRKLSIICLLLCRRACPSPRRTARRTANGARTRRAGQHEILAARSDQQGQRQEPAHRVALQDRQPRAASRLQHAGDAADGERRACTRRPAPAALSSRSIPTTGEQLWMWRMDEGKRGAAAPRQGSGRGVAYWTDGKGDERIVTVTPGYHLVALNAKTGVPVPTFGKNGIVDLKTEIDQPGIDLETARDRPQLAAGVGQQRRSSSAPRTCPAARRARRRTSRATSAASTCAPASGSGSSTPFRSPANSATTRGRTIRGRTRATPATGRRSRSTKS